MYNDEIILKYKINKNEKRVKIFGQNFVKNYKHYCKILYEDKKYELEEYFDVNNINNDILEIKLKGIGTIPGLREMFFSCNS